MDLEVGMYVRTKMGSITKIENEVSLVRYMGEIPNVKFNHKIINLIEVGDYVNGHKVTNLWKDNGKIIGVAVDSRVIGYDTREIISIVTKEQFESMSYKVD